MQKQTGTVGTGVTSPNPKEKKNERNFADLFGGDSKPSNNTKPPQNTQPPPPEKPVQQQPKPDPQQK